MHSLKSAITSGNSIQDTFCSPSRATEAIICKILVKQQTFHQKNTILTTTLTRRTKRDVVDSDVSKIGNAVVKRVISVECGLHFEIFTGLLTVRGMVDSTGYYRRWPYVFKKIMEIGLISIQVLYLSKHASFLHCFSRISLNWPSLRDVKGSIEAGRCDFYARVATFWFIENSW